MIQAEIFENKENINLENILPNKNINNRSKITQRNPKYDPELISLEKKAENLLIRNTNKTNIFTKKTKSKNPLNPPAYLIRNKSVFSFLKCENIFCDRRKCFLYTLSFINFKNL